MESESVFLVFESFGADSAAVPREGVSIRQVIHRTNHDSTILGIDPGTRFIRFAVLNGMPLLDYGVRTLRNGRRPYDLLGQARARVLASIRDHQPEVVAIEEPLLIPTKRKDRAPPCAGDPRVECWRTVAYLRP